MTKFRGDDWMELAAHFNIEISNPNALEGAADPIRRYLIRKLSDCYASPGKSDLDWNMPEIKACKKFLKAVRKASKNDYWGPVWAGILKVEHPQVFMDAFLPLIEYMWT